MNALVGLAATDEGLPELTVLLALAVSDQGALGFLHLLSEEPPATALETSSLFSSLVDQWEEGPVCTGRLNIVLNLDIGKEVF
jgi:hypothetical protein